MIIVCSASYRIQQSSRYKFLFKKQKNGSYLTPQPSLSASNWQPASQVPSQATSRPPYELLVSNTRPCLSPRKRDRRSCMPTFSLLMSRRGQVFRTLEIRRIFSRFQIPRSTSFVKGNRSAYTCNTHTHTHTYRRERRRAAPPNSIP